MAFRDLLNNPTFAAFRTRDDIGEQLRMVLSRYRADVERWTELLDLSDAIFDGVVQVTETPVLLAQAFGLSERDGWRMSRDLIAVELAPVRDVVDGLSAQIDAWRAAQPKDADGKKTYDDYAEDVLGRMHLSLSMQHVTRLASLIKKYLAVTHTPEQTLAQLERPIVIGGLGFTPDQSTALMKLVEDDKGKVTLVDGEIGRGVLNTPSNIPTIEQNVIEISPSHALANETPMAAKPPQKNDDTAEIAAHAKTMKKADIAPKIVDEKLDAAVNAAVTAATSTLQTARVAKEKFADIARLAIKGVRDPHQTRGIIERDLGVVGEPALDLIEAIMTGIGVYNANGVGETLAVAPPSAPSNANDNLDKRFAAIAGEMPTTTVDAVMPNARVSAARTVEEERAEQSANVDPAKLAIAAESEKPEVAHAMLTVGSVPKPVDGEQAVVTDVQFKPHLVGPVEELGTMSPADFRRLSSDAKEAARKVQDVLHALETTSFEDRIRGVQAWRQSPMNTLYTLMTSEALNNGVALAEVASRRRNKGDESLTPAELAAVADINAAIRF